MKVEEKKETQKVGKAVPAKVAKTEKDKDVSKEKERADKTKDKVEKVKTEEKPKVYTFSVTLIASDKQEEVNLLFSLFKHRILYPLMYDGIAHMLVSENICNYGHYYIVKE